MKFVLVNGRHPARNRSVRCAASQGRAIYEISRRGSPTAITNATSITAKFPSLHSKIMRWHHDNPGCLKIFPVNGSQPQATELRIVGLPPCCFSAWDAFETTTVESHRQHGELL
jgi:hypothetical protein